MIDQIICQSCHKSFSIDAKEREFLVRASPVIGGQQLAIPAPTSCPDCRHNRRLVWRNERKLYRRQCSMTNEEIISIYSPDKTFPVYKNSVWWGDSWDALSFGRDVDLNRSIFDQISALQSVVPRAASNLVDVEDSDYCNQSWHLNQCYLCFNAAYAEQCYYSDQIHSCNNCVDCLTVKKCEHCYGCIDCQHCNKCIMLQDCEYVHTAAFSYDCRNCSNIFLCSNLRNKQYCYNNEQLTKEAYEAKLAAINLGDRTMFERLAGEFVTLKDKATPATHNRSVEDCRGDYLTECVRCSDCFFCDRGQDCQYVTDSDDGKDSRDVNFSAEFELCYDSNMLSGYHQLFCVMTVGGQDNLYSYACYSSSNCFGCAGLRNKQYCIFNKQYSKEAYEALVPQIVETMKAQGEWGQFFLASMSPFGYNETVAQQRFPMSKEQAIAFGATWQDTDFTPRYDGPNYQPKDSIAVYRDSATEADQLINGIIKCPVSGRPFKFVGQEIAFYIEHNLPIPTKHPDIRFEERVKQRNASTTFRSLDSGEIDELSEAA